MELKTFLLVLCILNLQKNLQINCQEGTDVPVFNINPSNGDCGVDFTKLENEVQTIKKMLQDNKKDLVTEKPYTNDLNFKQLNSDIQNLKELINKFALSSVGKDTVELIKDNNNFVITKLLALRGAVTELIEKVDLTNVEQSEFEEKYVSTINNIDKNLNDTLFDFAKEQQKIEEILAENKNLHEKFQEHSVNVTQLIDAKFMQQENELKNVKSQNEEISKLLKELNDRLEQQDEHMKQHVEQIGKKVEETQLNFTNRTVVDINATLATHFVQHAATINKHGNSLKDIEVEIKKLEGKFGNKCTQFDTNKETVDKLIERFDKMAPFWQKLENMTAINKNSTEWKNVTIEVILD